MDEKSKRHLSVVKPPKEGMLKKIGKGIKSAGDAASSYLGLDDFGPQLGEDDFGPEHDSSWDIFDCSVDGCNTSEPHRHPTVIKDDMGTPSDKHPAHRGLVKAGHEFYNQNESNMENKARNSHFEHGASEHLGENVVSLAAFARNKASRKPKGY